MRRPRVLMCPPDHFAVEYEINPWMSRAHGVDRVAAAGQWQRLVAVLRDLGVQVEVLPPRPGLPDLVFTSDAGLVVGDRFYASRFRHPERERESPAFGEWFAAQGYEIHQPPDGVCFEGTGDAVFCGDTLFAGYGPRTNVRAHQWLAAELGVRVLSVQLVDPRFYHLDAGLSPLGPGLALWYPPAFDAYGQRVIRTHVSTLIEVVKPEAERLGCNAVVVGKAVVINTGCPRLAAALKSLEYEPIATPVDEFLKAGGGVKCLTLRLDGC